MATVTQTRQQDAETLHITTSSKSSLKVVLGAMNMGKLGMPQIRVHEIPECERMLQNFQSRGHSEIDTARVYGGGSSEELLGQLDCEGMGLTIGTKLNPRGFGPKKYSHKREALWPGLQESLNALKTHHIDLWYLHAPDHNTPFAETLEAVDELYKKGHFKRFGISNFAAWEVAQICELCEANGWKKPDVYQGVYNALQRSVEAELFPCLRHYGIAFYNFSPLAGGMLTDKYHRDTTEHEEGSRFDPGRKPGANYFRKQYWNDVYFDALDVIRPVALKHGIPTDEAAARWSSHHSKLKGSMGDAIIVGASSPGQLERNLMNLEQGPLPEELVKAFDDAWLIARGLAGPYYQ